VAYPENGNAACCRSKIAPYSLALRWERILEIMLMKLRFRSIGTPTMGWWLTRAEVSSWLTRPEAR
jgi:hypothetical protein